MRTKYEIKVEPLTFFLGVHFVFNDRGCVMDQSAQINKTLAAFKMNDCNPAPTPFAAGPQPSAADTEPTSSEAAEVQSFPYREIVGSLGYLQNATPPEITFPLTIASKSVAARGGPQAKLAKRSRILQVKAGFCAKPRFHRYQAEFVHVKGLVCFI